MQYHVHTSIPDPKSSVNSLWYRCHLPSPRLPTCYSLDRLFRFTNPSESLRDPTLRSCARLLSHTHSLLSRTLGPCPAFLWSNSPYAGFDVYKFYRVFVAGFEITYPSHHLQPATIPSSNQLHGLLRRAEVYGGDGVLGHFVTRSCAARQDFVSRPFFPHSQTLGFIGQPNGVSLLSTHH